MPSNFFASECSQCAKLTPLRGCSRRVLEASQLVAGMFWVARRAFLERYKELWTRTARASCTASKGKHWTDGRSPVRFVCVPRWGKVGQIARSRDTGSVRARGGVLRRSVFGALEELARSALWPVRDEFRVLAAEGFHDMAVPADRPVRCEHLRNPFRFQ